MKEKIIPFKVGLAKKITDGDIEGEILTRDNRKTRIIAWDAKDSTYPIIGLIDCGKKEECYSYSNDGFFIPKEESVNDLFIKIPSLYLFNDGDIIVSKNGRILITKGTINFDKIDGEIISECYVCFNPNFEKYIFDYNTEFVLNGKHRLATDKEIRFLVEEMNKVNNEQSLFILSKFFKNNLKQNFSFREIVLVRSDNNMTWFPAEYAFKMDDYHVMFGGIGYKQCIPYKGNEKLMGTSVNILE